MVPTTQTLSWEGFASGHAAELTPVEAEFVAASVEAREREAAAERERLEQQARSNKRLRRLLVATMGGSLIEIDPAIPRVLTVHHPGPYGEDAITAFAFSADGKTLATQDAGEGITIRDAFTLEDRAYLGAFPSDEGNIAEGATGDDSWRLATIVGEYALLWNLNLDEWPEIACRAAERNMTRDEWDQFGPEGEPCRATCPQWPSLG